MKELYFEYCNIQLYKGDCLNPHNFHHEFIDLIVTSPPYNVGIEYNSTIIWNESNISQKMACSSLYELAKQQNDKKLKNFCSDILNVFDQHNINGHIEWKNKNF